jgi:hypothetical protein
MAAARQSARSNFSQEWLEPDAIRLHSERLYEMLRNGVLYLNRAHAGRQHYLRALHANRFWLFMRPKQALSRRTSRHFERRDLKVATAWLELG